MRLAKRFPRKKPTEKEKDRRPSKDVLKLEEALNAEPSFCSKGAGTSSWQPRAFLGSVGEI